MILGIDGSNIKSDGGIVHLSELINNTNKLNQKKISKIIIWGDLNLLSKIKNSPVLNKIRLDNISANLIVRFYWQYFIFPRELVKKKCDIALIPGGIFFNKKIKTVSIFQNILPFMNKDIKKYGILERIKLNIQKKLYIHSFSNSDGLIFLSKFSKKVLKKYLKISKTKNIIIPHGVSSNFKFTKSAQNKTLKLLYISKIDFYKNHLILLEALSLLSRERKVILSLVGNHEKKFKNILLKKIKELNLQKKVKFYGRIDYKKLPKVYSSHNLKLYASGSETFGMTMLESIKCGLPVLAINNEISKEILKHSGYYCSDNPIVIKNKIKKIFENKKHLKQKIKNGLILANKFTWSKTSLKTLLFLSKI